MMTPEQIEVFRRMSPAEKLSASAWLCWSARALKRAALRALHPTLTPEQLERKVKEAFLYAGD